MMDTHSIRLLLLGALAMATWVIGIYFLRFWRTTRDRFFVLFAAAFWTLSAHWFSLGLVDHSIEARSPLYAMRLVAFGLIILAILDKNRRRR